jgi:acetyl esterase/lipase
VTFNHGSSERLTRLRAVGEEIDALIAWVRANGRELGIDADRLGIWACSAGVPYGMRAALQPGAPFIRCAVAYYGLLDLTHLRAEISPDVRDDTLHEFSALARLEAAPQEIPPTLVVKAALDNPRINDAIDRFVVSAAHLSAPVESQVHDSGHHGFDVLDDDDRSRALIRLTLDFLRAHLTS